MVDSTKYVVTEGISGVYHYHLSPAAQGGYVRGLCGAQTMSTAISVSSWGQSGGEHLAKRYTYCKECQRLATESP
jgi:hypothetical protein